MGKPRFHTTYTQCFEGRQLAGVVLKPPEGFFFISTPLFFNTPHFPFTFFWLFLSLFDPSPAYLFAHCHGVHFVTARFFFCCKN